jgi:NAD(P)-dependent dehydrogenase (short-subunit alcohol dehydrogenase family)
MSTSQVIVVTGATSGVGTAIVTDQLSRGVTVIATGRSERRLAALRELAESQGSASRLTIVQADLCNTEELDQLVEQVGTVAGDGIDAVVLVGFGHIGEDEGKALTDVTPEELSNFVTGSVTLNLCTTRAFVPLLKAGDGRVVAIVADWGLPQHNIVTSGESGDGQIGSEAFVAAKYAMTGMLTSLERQSGVTASGIYPGVIASWRGEDSEGEPEYLAIDSSEAEIGEAGYNVPHDAIPLADVAGAVEFALSSSATVRTLVLKPRRHDYIGL